MPVEVEFAAELVEHAVEVPEFLDLVDDVEKILRQHRLDIGVAVGLRRRFEIGDDEGSRNLRPAGLIQSDSAIASCDHVDLEAAVVQFEPPVRVQEAGAIDPQNPEDLRDQLVRTWSCGAAPRYFCHSGLPSSARFRDSSSASSSENATSGPSGLGGQGGRRRFGRLLEKSELLPLGVEFDLAIFRLGEPVAEAGPKAATVSR